jgi:hypothetical protein
MQKHHWGVPGMKKPKNSKDAARLSDEDFHKELHNFFKNYLTYVVEQHGEGKKQGLIENFLGINVDLSEVTIGLSKCGVLKKKAGTLKSEKCCRRFVNKVCKGYEARIFILSEEGIGFIKPKAAWSDNQQSRSEIRDFRLWDKNLFLKFGPNSTEDKFGITIETSNSFIQLRAAGLMDLLEWTHDILACVNKSIYTRDQRYESFSPIREKNYVKWYIDQQDPEYRDYYGDIYDAIEKAEQDIFILDWFLTPEIYLKRPVEKYPDTRLDATLKRAAMRGVKVYVLIWANSQVTGNDSVHARDTLEKLHPNIEVCRHPTHL